MIEMRQESIGTDTLLSDQDVEGVAFIAVSDRQ
jgi:hypothetical protein